MPIAEAEFSSLVHGVMDVDRPDGWVHLDAVLSVGSQVRVVDLTATDEAGVVLVLDRDEAVQLAARFIEAFHRGGHRGRFHQG